MTADLNWLLPRDPALEDLLKFNIDDSSDFDQHLLRLSHYQLSLPDSQKISGFLESIPKNSLNLDSFRHLKIALIGQNTLSFLSQSLMAAGLRHGLIITSQSFTFNEIIPSIGDSISPINDSFDYVIVWPEIETVLKRLNPTVAPFDLITHHISHIKKICNWIISTLGSTPVIGLCGPAHSEIHMSVDLLNLWSERSVRKLFNSEILKISNEINAHIWDIEMLSSSIGYRKWLNHKQYYWAKQPFDLSVSPLVADSLARVFSAASGKSRRALVLDLDNTVWGGVVGEDGLHSLEIGLGSTQAEAFRAVQEVALALKRRGVILAVCSKNDDDIARAPFRELEDMVLKESDFSVFLANWDDKATNIELIANKLNLTTSSLAFFDDNPAERARIRHKLPEVAVIEPGQDPSFYAEHLASCGYFEHLYLTEEDLSRGDNLFTDTVDAISTSSSLSGANYDDYLLSLEMKLEVSNFQANSIQRITQLINKSNQFNLTTKRYSVTEVTALRGDANYLCLQSRLQDKFTNHGLVAVMIVDINLPDVWTISSWLMSCRVINRNVEHAMLCALAEHAKKAGVNCIFGTYFKTKKNKLVKDLYSELGFQFFSATTSSSTWQLFPSQYVHANLPMQVITIIK